MRPRPLAGVGARPLNFAVSFHGYSVPSPKKTFPSLQGAWKSNRARTLAFWGFPPRTPAKFKRLIQSREMFGHLIWRVTRTHIHYSTQGTSGSLPYRIIWRDPYRAVLRVGKGPSSTIRDIHFDGPNYFYMLGAKANCEFFRRVEANNRWRGP
jgi:hypothetical protein